MLTLLQQELNSSFAFFYLCFLYTLSLTLVKTTKGKFGFSQITSNHLTPLWSTVVHILGSIERVPLTRAFISLHMYTYFFLFLFTKIDSMTLTGTYSSSLEQSIIYIWRKLEQTALYFRLKLQSSTYYPRSRSSLLKWFFF